LTYLEDFPQYNLLTQDQLSNTLHSGLRFKNLSALTPNSIFLSNTDSFSQGLKGNWIR